MSRICDRRVTVSSLLSHEIVGMTFPTGGASRACDSPYGVHGQHSRAAGRRSCNWQTHDGSGGSCRRRIQQHGPGGERCGASRARSPTRSRAIAFASTRNNAVQVYILMSAVTDDTVRQLTDAGVTIEIRDAARRRVQARVPVVAALARVAQLAVVDAVRLPTYARRARRRRRQRRRRDPVRGRGPRPVRARRHRRPRRRPVGRDQGRVRDRLHDLRQRRRRADGDGRSADVGRRQERRRRAHARRPAASSARSFSANRDLEGLPPASPACAFAGAGAEGTALLEIVHDLAPGREADVRQRRHRPRLQPGGQLSRRVERRRARRHRLFRRALRRHERRVSPTPRRR